MEYLCYFVNIGGCMLCEMLDFLCCYLFKSKFFLMYGLIEVFCLIFLLLDEVDCWLDFIGKVILNVEILVLCEDGLFCVLNELGELVYCGVLVGLGYWNDLEKIVEWFKFFLVNVGCEVGLVLLEIVVFFGDIVCMDEDGFFYFIGCCDEMIKIFGYWVSLIEVEEIFYVIWWVGECVVFGIDNE